ncbi:class I SAM-dependent methyltransferase [Palleronia pelagia]|uniref:16S rRNA (Guanine1207-N2)-methyltransferase n=1 Tax=Palleronia pelagia TaxID=387096 RepID=A0A1H8J8S0_9RHOB|nr:methyltransferase [Palleronia pelagia]SEN76686.1 16S rRNA (guanine1207-N2)-methyltransferase [Palleronia pelagia]
MADPRLSIALDDGLIEAPLAILGATDDADYSDLPAPLTLVCDRQPDFDRLGARGFDVSRSLTGTPATVVVALPRERDLARDRVARAAATGARVLVDGAKTDGVDAMLKACRARGSVGAVISKSHGKIFAIEDGDFADWRAEPSRNADGFWTAPGSFSADASDPASVALADALWGLKGRVVDLGAGWGYLSARALEADEIKAIDLVEADHATLDCARRNVTSDRAAFHWADATTFTPAERADHVISNPPFHKGRKGAPDLGQAFIVNAARILAPRGSLWLVANRHLPYERTLAQHFADVTELPGTSAFKLYRATRPRRAR